MRYILILINIIANIILFPFFVLYVIFDRMYEDTDRTRNIGVFLFSIGWGIYLFINKNPEKYGWFSYIMMWIILFVVSLTIFTLVQWMLADILRSVFEIPSEIFALNCDKINKYTSEISNKDNSENTRKKYKHDIKEQADAEVSLNYFIDLDEKKNVPYIKYIND